jgi:hypothetical protein
MLFIKPFWPSQGALPYIHKSSTRQLIPAFWYCYFGRHCGKKPWDTNFLNSCFFQYHTFVVLFTSPAVKRLWSRPENGNPYTKDKVVTSHKMAMIARTKTEEFAKKGMHSSESRRLILIIASQSGVKVQPGTQFARGWRAEEMLSMPPEVWGSRTRVGQNVQPSHTSTSLLNSNYRTCRWCSGHVLPRLIESRQVGSHVWNLLRGGNVMKPPHLSVWSIGLQIRHTYKFSFHLIGSHNTRRTNLSKTRSLAWYMGPGRIKPARLDPWAGDGSSQQGSIRQPGTDQASVGILLSLAGLIRRPD